MYQLHIRHCSENRNLEVVIPMSEATRNLMCRLSLVKRLLAALGVT